MASARERRIRLRSAAALAVAAVLAAAWLGVPDAAASALDRLKALFERPDTIPFPPDNPYSAAKAALGARLFAEPRLSGNGSFSCASCHDARLGFEDGLARGAGVAGEPLARHTPTLWNMAWNRTFFWDGRAASLEEQARVPIENPSEMNRPVGPMVAELAADASYSADFAKAFPDDPRVTPENLFAALATFERTLVPRPTRFDRWVEGDEDALSEAERRGFLVFNGKGRCAVCHSGFNFTDQAFHDTGLPDSDLGRGAVIGIEEANHAFKTPSLIDVADRAPYMHDGSLPDLAAVIDHYEHGIVERPTLSPDLKPVALSKRERADLLAFLKSLDATGPLAPEEVARLAAAPEPTAEAEPVATSTIVQDDMAFSPRLVRVEAGEPVTIVNRDDRTHTADVNDPKLKFSSGANRPGGTVTIEFPEPGKYTVICSIHPAMRLRIKAE